MTEDERDRTLSALRHFDGDRYLLHAFVVMNDHVHVHVLVEPSLDRPLEGLLQSWKSFTANQFQRHCGRVGSVWQDEYFDRVVRDQAEYEQKRDYILANPGKRWPEIGTYRWCWALGME